VARQSVISNALPVVALGSVVLALVALPVQTIGSVGDLLGAVAVLGMLGSSWGCLARHLGRTNAVWEAVAVSGLMVMGWVTFANMMAAALPGGMTATNRVLLTALLPLGCILLRDPPFLFDPTKRPGRAALVTATTCVSLAISALLFNVISERVWLRHDGPALFVSELPARTLVVANRTGDEARYRVLVEGATRRIDQTVTLQGWNEGTLNLETLGPGGAVVRVFDLDDSSSEPVLRLSLTGSTRGEEPPSATPSPSATPTPSLSPSSSGG